MTACAGASPVAMFDPPGPMGIGDGLVEAKAAGFEQFGEHLRVQEERRAEVEAEVAALAGQGDGGGASAGLIAAFDQGDAQAGLGQEHGAGEAAGSGADDQDVFAHKSLKARLCSEQVGNCR